MHHETTQAHTHTHTHTKQVINSLLIVHFLDVSIKTNDFVCMQLQVFKVDQKAQACGLI